MKRWLTLLVVALAFGVQESPAQVNAGLSRDTSKWYNRTHSVREVTVKSKRQRYRRRDNPAVELMRRVIAARKRTDLDNHDYYRYDKYQKLTFAANDVDPNDMTTGIVSRIPGLMAQIELCPYNNKLILPLTYSETITQKLYRRSPRKEQNVVRATRSEGIGDFFQTGDIVTTAIKDFFTDVDIYDNQVRLFQHRFTSPIGDDAIRFYRFYIQDTLQVGGDSCIHLAFLPNNQRDFGFSGDLYVLNDGTYRVRRCHLTMPKKSEVNFVDGIVIVQEFAESASGEWLLVADDMIVELELYDFLPQAVVIRTTRLTGHDFNPIADEAFSDAAAERARRQAKHQPDDFWEQNRQADLTHGERGMGNFLGAMEQGSAYQLVMAALKLLVENFVETGTASTPSKVDIGPVNTMVTSNFIDGLRTRIGAQTTANLSPHWFAKGYYARGWKSHKDYYMGQLTYAFNAKDYLPHEQLRRNLTLTSTYDVAAPTDRFMTTDKDNVFTSLKWTTVDKMMFYNRQQLNFEWEWASGWSTAVAFTAEENEPCGTLEFRSMPLAPQSGGLLGSIRTTQARFQLRFAPGEQLVNTKQRSRPINREAPVLTLSHTVGLQGVLGGQYRYNFTEATFFKRFWAKSWGKIDLVARAGAQWNQVPFPLLIMPAANLSYIVERGTFRLINNMEFLNDRYASIDLSWDMNGKLFNRIPLINRLKWREYLGVRVLWGDLTSKNNPQLSRNAASSVLMQFPEGSFAMDPSKPYVELSAGVHNVFRFFHVEYVRRLNYLDLPTANKHGVRVKVDLQF